MLVCMVINNFIHFGMMLVLILGDRYRYLLLLFVQQAHVVLGQAPPVHRGGLRGQRPRPTFPPELRHLAFRPQTAGTTAIQRRSDIAFV